MSEENKSQLKIKRWIKHEERSLSNKWYSMGRVDTLIISICGGGLYVVFETFKFVKEQHLNYSFILLKWASIILTLSVLINFASQILGFFSNKFEAINANLQIKKETDGVFDEELSKKLMDRVEFYDGLLNKCNLLSIATMIAGIVLIALFYFNF